MVLASTSQKRLLFFAPLFCDRKFFSNKGQYHSGLSCPAQLSVSASPPSLWLPQCCAGGCRSSVNKTR